MKTLTFTLSFVCLAIFCSVQIQGQTFTDIASDYGLDEIINLTGNFGTGVSFFDFNDDGWDDLTIGTHDSPIRFYTNVDGELQETTLSGISLVNKEIKQFTWVDFDNDGDYDFTVGFWDEPYRFYQNNGDMSFTQLNPTVTGITPEFTANGNITWGDYDLDGDLDVYLGKTSAGASGNFEEDYPFMNRLYRNDGNAEFTDVTIEAGVSDGIGITYGVVWWDYNEDGWPDLFVANDKQYENGLYMNNGDGTFTDMSAESGLGVVMDAMCASPADYDNDGDLDMYVTNTHNPAYENGNALFNNNNGVFQNVAAQTGSNHSVFQCWGGSWLDYDNDGWQDLYIATIELWPNYPGMNVVYKNNSDGTFSKANTQVELSNHANEGYSNAVGDLNNDGFPDIISHTEAPYAPSLLLNSGGDNNWLKVNLEGVVSNRDAIGSTIRCYTDGLRQTKYTHCGENYMGQHSGTKLFGLAEAEIIDSLVVKWPNGHIDRFYNIDPNQTLHILEGSSIDIDLSLSGVEFICPEEELSISVPGYEDITWSTGQSSSSLSISEEGIYYAAVETSVGEILSDSLQVILSEIPFVIEEVENISCPDANDGTVNLFLEDAADLSVEWSDGSESTYRSNLESGYYFYAAANIHGCVYQGMIQIEDADELEFDSEILSSCANEASGGIVLSEFNYEVDLSWSTGSTDSILNNLAAGEIIEGSIAYGACIQELNFEIPSYPSTEFELEYQSPLCFESEDGFIAIHENSSDQIVSILWNDGEYAGAELNGLPAGNYTSQIIDEFGCHYNASIDLSSPAEIVITTIIAPDENSGISCPDTWFGTAFAQGGQAPYSYEWTIEESGEPVVTIHGTDFDCFHEGLIELLVTDANGCTSNEIFELELLVNMDELESVREIMLYPNPSSQHLNISGTLSPQWSYAIFNSLGQQLKSGIQLNMEPIDISNLPEANYYLIVFDESMNVLERFPFIKIQ